MALGAVKILMTEDESSPCLARVDCLSLLDAFLRLRDPNQLGDCSMKTCCRDAKFGYAAHCCRYGSEDNCIDVARTDPLLLLHGGQVEDTVIQSWPLQYP
jgi:hypothetical protein